ncbi:hypothetical protein HPB52_013275 [Rhipicephalus sanguineus]|uniref:Uncharacterized protein n=1 Tax=Rhipicephalus sanguineus TaxID=34632 RepID=A0A9D4T4D2_RHISA|nr:hypothetical protein HPB52_013275 [Rhipicephalus sanguineus]
MGSCRSRTGAQRGERTVAEGDVRQVEDEGVPQPQEQDRKGINGCMYDKNTGGDLLFEARAGALRTLVSHRRFDGSTDDTRALRRVCEQEEETMQKVVLHCPCLRPRQREGTTLSEALAFGEHECWRL